MKLFSIKLYSINETDKTHLIEKVDRGAFITFSGHFIYTHKGKIDNDYIIPFIYRRNILFRNKFKEKINTQITFPNASEITYYTRLNLIQRFSLSVIKGYFNDIIKFWIPITISVTGLLYSFHISQQEVTINTQLKMSTKRNIEDSLAIYFLKHKIFLIDSVLKDSPKLKK